METEFNQEAVVEQAEADTSSPLRIGLKIKDNDPRRGERVLEIVEMSAESVKAKDAKGRSFSVLKRRIHTDGKRRTKGFQALID